MVLLPPGATSGDLSGRGLATKYGGSSYDPADATFHARYLALIDAVAKSGLCQETTWTNHDEA